MAVYIGTNRIRVPWDGMIAYYPLTSETTVNDMSVNWNTLTNTNSVTFWTYQWVDSASFSWGSSGSYLVIGKSLWTWNSKFTVSQWFYKTSAASSDATFWAIWDGNNANTIYTYVEWWLLVVALNTTEYLPSMPSCPLNSWNLLTITHDGSTVKCYLNWSLVSSKSKTLSIANLRTCIGKSVNLSSTRPRTWYLSECIFENYAWDSSDIAIYYNQTKGKYWIS